MTFHRVSSKSTDPRTSRFLILGCGHTGTTLISGILHINGYGSFNVSRLFENTRLNDLNQRILDGEDVRAAEIQNFLAAVERKTKGRWALKDPRLSETVSRFYAQIDDPVGIIFNYRHPATTVRSLIKEREMHESHLTPAVMLRNSEDEWLKRNRAVLEFLDNDNRSPVLMIRYDDLVDGSLNETLSRFIGKPVDTTFIDPSRRHSDPVKVRQELLDVYDDLNFRLEANMDLIARTTSPVGVKARHGRTLRTRVHVESNRVINGLRWRLDRIRSGGSP